MLIFSICCGAGLLDGGFREEGLCPIPMCEIDPRMREMYHAWHDEDIHFDTLLGATGAMKAGRVKELASRLGSEAVVVIGGPPCQAHSIMRAMRAPKYGDLTGEVEAFIHAVAQNTGTIPLFIMENVSPVQFTGLDAMHFAKPHQSRPRWFTVSPSLRPPPAVYEGDVNSLMAYPAVAARIYGPKRGAVLQGCPSFAALPFPCEQLQLGLANGVHVALARGWARSLKQSVLW